MSTAPISSGPPFHIRFVPNTIFETGDPLAIELSQVAKVHFENLQALTKTPSEYLYIIEEEIDAHYEGDFNAQTLVQRLDKSFYHSLSHNPAPVLKQIGKTTLQDQVSTVLDKRKSAKNGSLTWRIPTFIFDAQEYLSIDPSSLPPKTISLLSITSHDDDLPRPSLEATIKKYHLNLIHRIDVIQRYVLEDGFLTMIKHEQVLFQYNLTLLGFNQTASSSKDSKQALQQLSDSKEKEPESEF